MPPLKRPVLPPGVSQRALSALRDYMPAVTVAHLGAQIDPAAFDRVMQTYRSTKRIDFVTIAAQLTRPALTGKFTRNLRLLVISWAEFDRLLVSVELLVLCPDVESIFFDQSVDTAEADLAFVRQLCPKLQVLRLGCAISAQTFEQLLSEYEATKRLDLWTELQPTTGTAVEALPGEAGMHADATFTVSQTHIRRTPHGSKCPAQVSLKVDGMGLTVCDGELIVESHLYFEMKSWMYNRAEKSFDIQLTAARNQKIRFGTPDGVAIADAMLKHAHFLADAKKAADTSTPTQAASKPLRSTHLTEDGLAELLTFCPEPVAIFTGHADLDIESLKLRCPSLQ